MAITIGLAGLDLPGIRSLATRLAGIAEPYTPFGQAQTTSIL